MMQTTRRRGPVYFALICIPGLCGCATFTRPDNPFEHEKSGLEITLPEGWLQYTPEKKAVVLTRDGLRLETIVIRVVKIGEQLPDTQRSFQADMLPNEIAELSLGLMQAREETKNFRLEKIESARLAGADGFRAEARYFDARGLPKRLRGCGAQLGDYVCEFWFDAEASTYFKRYEDAFESCVASAHRPGS